MEVSPNYDSKFNMAFMKLARIDKQITIAEHAANEDLHSLWRTALDNIRREIYSYLTKEDRQRINQIKLEAQRSLLTYLGWDTKSSNTIGNHYRQTKQLDVELALDIYHTTLIEFLKKCDMDMPKKDDIRSLTERGRF